MRGDYGLIDNDTPKEAYTKPSWRDPSVEMQLVFSDEFNVDGRTFYPGDDPYWEAVDLHYWVWTNLGSPSWCINDLGHRRQGILSGMTPKLLRHRVAHCKSHYRKSRRTVCSMKEG